MGVLLGDKPKTKITTKSTLTAEQQAALNKLLTTAGGNVSDPGRNRFLGDVTTGGTALDTLSLQALEDRAVELGTGGSELEQQSNQALLDLISSGGAPSGQGNFEEFFRTNVQNPLLETFEEDLVGIGRRFGGTSLFGSERREADARARGDFGDALTSSRANLQFQERTSNADRLLEALGIGTEMGIAKDFARFGVADASFGQRRLDQADIAKQLEAFALEKGLDIEDLKVLLGGIGTKAVENIAITSGGSSGILGPLIGAGGSIAAASILVASDSRLKRNIKQIATIGPLRLVTWMWNKVANTLGLNGNSVGFIAQEVEKIYPQFVIPIHGVYKGILYNPLCVQILNSQENV